MVAHRFDKTILREYDIRGIVGETLFAADAYAIGRCFAATVQEGGGQSVAVAYDGRLTSPELEAALVVGLAEGGVDVVRVGRGPTPMLYYASATLEVGGGIMVTGSHNPPDHNGFKIVLGGKPFYGAAIQGLADTALGLGAGAEVRGRVDERLIFDEYVTRISRDYDGTRPLAVAWDPGNGAAGEVTSRIAALLPGRHTIINAEIDGHFPAHHPDPTVPENLVQLQQTVSDHGCDLGIAFDGDGDRIGVVDARGRILWGDQLMILLARDVLAALPGAQILADVKASQIFFDEIALLGGRPLMLPTGHSPMKAKLAETGAPLAGEMSGHIFFADRYYGFDDAIYTAVRLLGIVSRSGESLADTVDRLPTVINTPELRLPCEEARKFAIVAEIHERLRQRGADITDSWWLVRASNTQAIIVARAEARNEVGFAKVKAELAAELAASGLALPDA
jgi:phosphomannomutase